MSSLRAYLQLLRLPNVFTALADVFAGFFLAMAGESADRLNGLLPALYCLLASSACLYLGGMTLNDVFDLEVDARERPQRPLPSGRVSLRVAQRLGFGLLLFGILFGAVAGCWARTAACGAIAVLLALTVLAYDGFAKQAWFGPLVMGLCRGLNLFLGMSVLTVSAATVLETELPSARDEAPSGSLRVAAETAKPASPVVLAAPGWLPWRSWHYLAALGMTVYVTGITVFARREAVLSKPMQLLLGLALMELGIAALAALPNATQGEFPFAPGASVARWRTLVVGLAVLIGFRCVRAIFDPAPRNVQIAVKNSILSIIMLDACLCLAAVGVPIAAAVLLALLLPALILGHWVYST